MLVEVPDAGFMRYLGYKPHDDALPRALWPQFASGRVYVSSGLSNLLVQSYYNASLVPILSKLLDPSGIAVTAQHTIAPKPTVDADDEGDAPDDDDDADTQMRAARTRVRLRQVYPENGYTMHLRVPSAFVARRFGELFMELILTRGMLAVAVYRAAAAHGAPLPYVITNPPASLRLHEEDHILVLCAPAMVPGMLEREQEMQAMWSPHDAEQQHAGGGDDDVDGRVDLSDMV